METLKLAIQKSGRLNEGSLELIKKCDISLGNHRKDKLKAIAGNFPMELLYLRNDDIPQYVEDSVADIAIIGENTMIEKNRDIIVHEKLGFSRCRLAMAIPKHIEYTGIEWFQGKKIATSYPFTLKQFLEKNNIDAEIHIITGSVEIAPGIGLADAICDLVSSGSTLFSNGLKEVESVLKSEAVLVSNKKLSEEKKALLEKLLFRIRSILKARKANYILLNAPNEKLDKICQLLPGMKSPTIMPLHEKGWSSVHSVVYQDQFWEVIDKLQEYGAEGILVTPIEKMI